MKKLLQGLLFAALCIFCSPARTDAQVTLYTDVFHDTWGGLNQMVGVVYTQTNYSSSYCVDVDNYFYRLENDEVVDSTQTTMLGVCEFQAWTESFLPYVEGSDYDVEGAVTATPVFSYNDYPYGYYDPAGYAYYNQLDVDGNPVVYPWWFSFSSTGGPPRSPLAGFFLGFAYSYLGAGATSRSGPPHHLRVYADDIGTGGSCGYTQRVITYRMVDSSNRPAGRNSRKEVFPGVITDSCTGQTVAPTPCHLSGVLTQSSNFQDEIHVGCPAGNVFCGFTINPNKWVWCPPGKPEVTLATVEYDVRKSYVAIAGSASRWPASTDFLP